MLAHFLALHALPTPHGAAPSQPRLHPSIFWPCDRDAHFAPSMIGPPGELDAVLSARRTRDAASADYIIARDGCVLHESHVMPLLDAHAHKVFIDVSGADFPANHQILTSPTPFNESDDAEAAALLRPYNARRHPFNENNGVWN